MLPSASVGSEIGLYEPIHGSAPDIAGKNLANPLATILSAALLLKDAFDMQKEGDAIINAVDQFLKEGYRSKDIADDDTDASKILGTKEVGEQVLSYIK